MVDIIPAIMPATYDDLVRSAERVKDFVPLVQIDIMDGIFVEGKTWPYANPDKNDEKFNAIIAQSEKLPFADSVLYEADLMVKAPERVVEDWMHAGVRRIIAHLESTENMGNIIQDISAHITQGEGEALEVVSLGIAINTTTSPRLLEPYIEYIDFVQCMGIAHIGKQGEPFDKRVLDQLRVLRELYPGLVLSVDGSVHFENARELVLAGANRLVSGSGIFESRNAHRAIEKFHDILKSI